MRSVQLSLCAGMLILQAVVLFLTTPVLLSLTDVPTWLGVAIGIGLTLLCIVAAGMVRRPGGMQLGWAIQGITFLLGFVITAMFALGVVFGSLWAGSYYLGARIDRERAERLAES